MKGQGIVGRRGTILILIGLCAGLSILLLFSLRMHVTEKTKLNGLLVDLEMGEPNPDRYAPLRHVLTQRIPREFPFLDDVELTLDYIHFSHADKGDLASSRVDFVLLSPQGTPWYRYDGDAGHEIEGLKKIVRDTILDAKKPVLGICGGHQFLALAFGGTVGFIDPALAGTHPDLYPKTALAERGEVVLETLGDDPIFRGVAPYPGRFAVMQSHYEEVKTIPEPFVNLARSAMSEVQLIRMPGHPVYGMAFHPERGWDSQENPGNELNGAKRLLANFVGMVASRKRSR
jgi:GMP synthase-like glutamine amidotransferase